MKILIIDDEPKIRRGLQNLVQKHKPDWETIIASDGVSALELMEEQPDLLLLDIKMPNMDGMEFLEKLAFQKREVMVVIISGYAEFEYAQKAVKFGVLDYILKPVNPEKVREILEKAEQIKANKNELKNSSIYVEKNLHELREKFLYDLIFETVNFSNQELREKCELLKITVTKFYVVTILVQPTETDLEQFKPLVRNPDIKNALYGRLTRYDGGYVFCNGYGSFIMIFSLEKERNPQEQMSELHGELLQIFKGLNVTIGFGGIYENILLAADSYKESLVSIKNKKLGPKFEEKTPKDDTGIGLIFTNIKNNPGKYSVLIRQSVDYIMINYSKNIRLNDIAKSVFVNPNYLSELFKKETGANISDFIMEYRIEKAKQLLEKFENKVYMVAEKTGFHDQRYFSQVFKKKTGMTPAEYREKRFIENSN
jgi:Response regulator containing CheY-like receiver domain and AraC-type DNA-binding domain